MQVIPDAGLLADPRRQLVEEGLPVASVGHAVELVGQVPGAGLEHFGVVIGLAQIAVHQLLDGAVGNFQQGTTFPFAGEGQQAQVVQQRNEVVLPQQPLDREAGLHRADLFAGLDDLAQSAEIAVQAPVDLHQMPQLAVVDAHVVVDQLVGRRLESIQRLQVIQRHVAVDDGFGARLVEVIVVVPVIDNGAMGAEILAEGAEQGLHLGVIEAEQAVEFGIEADVGADVEAAGDIVHGERRDAGDEQPRQTAARAARGPLEQGEKALEKPAAMGQLAIRRFALVDQDIVGEMVVLIDEEIKLKLALGQEGKQPLQALIAIGLAHDRRRFVRRNPVGMALEQVVDANARVSVEGRLQTVQHVDHGKIEAQGQILPLLRGRVSRDPGIGEQFLKPFGPLRVVVAFHHRLQEAFAEAARADQKEKPSGGLQQRQVVGFVDVILVASTQLDEVGHAIGNA